MLKLTCEINDVQAELVECYGYEHNEDSHWTIIRRKPEDPYELTGYFSNKEELDRAWQVLKNYVTDSLPENIKVEEIDEHDWKERYKDFLDIWEYKGLAWVPVWKRNQHSMTEKVRVLFDAGMAFGTGDHPTTQLCAKRLIEFGTRYPEIYHETRIIDAGCGSGILAITAKMLGCQDVYGFDIDPEAVRVSKENLTLNDLPEDAVDFREAGIESGLKDQKADLIMANIQADILGTHADCFVPALTPGGVLVLSGILAKEMEDCKQRFLVSFAAANIHVKSAATRQSGDWSDICFQT